MKEIILSKEGIPTNEVRLYTDAAQQMEDHHSISHYKLRNGDTIRLVLRLQVGAYHISSGRDGFGTLGEDSPATVAIKIKYGPEKMDEFALKVETNITEESLIETVVAKMDAIEKLQAQIDSIKREER